MTKSPRVPDPAPREAWPDEDPPDRGIAELLEAARRRAEQMQMKLKKRR